MKLSDLVHDDLDALSNTEVIPLLTWVVFLVLLVVAFIKNGLRLPPLDPTYATILGLVSVYNVAAKGANLALGKKETPDD